MAIFRFDRFGHDTIRRCEESALLEPNWLFVFAVVVSVSYNGASDWMTRAIDIGKRAAKASKRSKQSNERKKFPLSASSCTTHRFRCCFSGLPQLTLLYLPFLTVPAFLVFKESIYYNIILYKSWAKYTDRWRVPGR